jgi:hypothetical protein
MMRLKRVDLPTFGLPTIATTGFDMIQGSLAADGYG